VSCSVEDDYGWPNVILDYGPVSSYSDGILCNWWTEVPDLPRIMDFLFGSVIYLYPSVDEAEADEPVGGSGFLVRYQSEVHKEIGYTYAVSNKHVVKASGRPSRVIRLNDRRGGSEAKEIKDKDWLVHPDGDDVAIAHLLGLDPQRYEFTAIPTSMFITPEIIEKWKIGPGDEAFMIGRFVGHNETERIRPSARFGNISMMACHHISHPHYRLQESFVLETRSLGGYSGSPVFVHTPYGDAHFAGEWREARQKSSGGPWLLGVDWGHTLIYRNVLDGETLAPVQPRMKVEINSGMMNVVPAWQLQKLLDDPTLATKRSKSDEKITKLKAREGVAILDVDTKIPFDY
jgi:hypothetical protein